MKNIEYFLKKISSVKGLLFGADIILLVDYTILLIIPGLFEPPVRTLRATIPENESHIFR